MGHSWITRTFVSSVIMTILLLLQGFIMVVCVVAIGLWDHSGDIEYASHLVLIPLYTMATFALQEMYGYLHPQMEFFMMRKVLRFIYNVILTIMFWLSVWWLWKEGTRGTVLNIQEWCNG